MLEGLKIAMHHMMHRVKKLFSACGIVVSTASNLVDGSGHVIGDPGVLGTLSSQQKEDH